MAGEGVASGLGERGGVSGGRGLEKSARVLTDTSHSGFPCGARLAGKRQSSQPLGGGEKRVRNSRSSATKRVQDQPVPLETLSQSKQCKQNLEGIQGGRETESVAR